MSLSAYCIDSTPNCGKDQIAIGGICYDAKPLPANAEENPSCNVFQELLYINPGKDSNIMDLTENDTFPACVERCNSLPHCSAVQFNYGEQNNKINPPQPEPYSYGFGTQNWKGCTNSTLGTTTGTCKLINNLGQGVDTCSLTNGPKASENSPPECCSTLYFKTTNTGSVPPSCLRIYPNTKEHHEPLVPTYAEAGCTQPTQSPLIRRPSSSLGIEVDLTSGKSAPQVTRINGKYTGSNCRSQIALNPPDVDTTHPQNQIALQEMGNWCNKNTHLAVCNQFCNNSSNQLYCKQKPYPVKMIIFLILFCIITFFFIFCVVKGYSFTIKGTSFKKGVYGIFILAMLAFFVLAIIYIIQFVKESTVFNGMELDTPIQSQNTVLNNACNCTGPQCQL